MSDDIQAEDLLEYARGNLSAERCASVELACKADKTLAEELAYYQGLRAAVRNESFAVDEAQWEKLSLAIDDLDIADAPPMAANDRGRVWRWAACALGAAFIGQTAFITIKGAPSKADDAIYTTVTANGAENQLQVSFIPLATEGDIRALLLEVEAEIVQGPSAIGLYVLGFKSEAETTSALQTLSAQDNIIESVTEK